MIYKKNLSRSLIIVINQEVFEYIRLKEGVTALENYKRLVSYMYNYENGIKGNNVGYAKIEIRNTQCKITLHIRVLSLNEKQLNTYIFHRENGIINCILLGSASVKNGVCEYRIITNSDGILDSGYSFDEMSGIIIYASKDKYFGTQWDDKPIDLRNIDVTKYKVKDKTFVEQKTDNSMDAQIEQENIEAAQLEEVVMEQALTLEKEREELEEIEDVGKSILDEILNMNHDDHKVEEDVLIPEIEKKLEEVLKDEMEKEANEKLIKESDMFKEIINGINDMNTKKEKPEKDVESFSGRERAEQIFDKYPKMFPFEDDEVMDCVRIEPQDIGMFPMEYWVYANNSFLLHSYYSYRHLLFAKKKIGNSIEYMVGVPGIYHNREQFMARMFGFPYFKSIKNRELKPGEFGYWYFIMLL